MHLTFFLLLFAINAAFSQTVVEDYKTHIYKADSSDYGNVFWHFDVDGLIYTIRNPDDFPLEIGFAQISYNYTRYDVYLTKYTFLSDDPRVKKNLQADPSPVNGCPYYNSKLKLALIRCQRWGSDSCISMTTANYYMKMIDSWLRMMTYDRVSVDFDTSYISSKCCAVSSEIYQSASHGDMMNSAVNDCKITDPKIEEKYSSRMFVSDGNFNWAGLGVVGSATSIKDRYNYWAIMRYPNDPDVQWKYDYNGGVLIHEFGHNMGFNHAGFVAEKPSYFLPNFYSPNNYGDGANVMGTAGSWTTIPGPYHYFRVVSIAKPEPHWYAKVETGTTKYRMFEWDHPYSRAFLGGDSPRLSEDTMIEGIPFKNNIMIIEIPYNREDMCSTVDEKYTYGSFTLEFRTSGGFSGFGKYSLRATNFRVEGSGYSNGVSILLDAQTDQLLDQWADATIPFGIYYIPPEVDRGFIAIHLTKVQKLSDAISFELLEKEVQPLNNIPYMEFDVTYLPGYPYVPAPVPTGITEFKFSENLYDCTMKDDVSGFNCKVMNTKLFFGYMPPQGVRGHPRLYYINNGNAFAQSVPAALSINGNDLLNYYYGYGDVTRHTLRVDVSYQDGPSFRLNYWMNCKHYSKAQNAGDDQYSLVESGAVILADNIPFTEKTRVVLTDLYGNTVDVTQDAAFIAILPEFKVTGATEIYLKIYEGDSVVGYKTATVRNTYSTKRFAVYQMTESNIQVGHASIPPNYFTLPTSFLKARTIPANTWFPSPITRMDFGDWFYIDFDGCIPADTTMYLDMDLGIKQIYLGRFEGWCDFSIRLTYTSLHAENSISGNVGGVMFNKDVGFLGLRPVYVSRKGNNLPNQGAGTDYYNLNEQRHKFDFGAMPNTFDFQSFETTINGASYTFSTIDTVFTLNVKEVYPFNWNIIWYILAALAGLAVIIAFGCFIKCVCCRSRSKAQPTNTLPLNTARSPMGPPPPINRSKPNYAYSPPPPPKPTSVTPAKYYSPPPPPKPAGIYNAPPPPPPVSSKPSKSSYRAPPPPPSVPSYRR